MSLAIWRRKAKGQRKPPLPPKAKAMGKGQEGGKGSIRDKMGTYQADFERKAASV